MSEQKKKLQSTEQWGAHLIKKLIDPFLDESISVTVIIPTYNCANCIGKTLESIAEQNYPLLELLIIDAGSSDCTLEIMGNFKSLVTRIYNVTDYNLFEMINRGISHASGSYIQILLPGSIFLSCVALKTFAGVAKTENMPQVLYMGTIQREANRTPRLVHYPLDKEHLERGIAPATLPACWIHKQTFTELGKFRLDLKIRSPFDFFCRLALAKELKTVCIDKVFIDFDLGRSTYARLALYAADSWRILFRYFGFWKTLKWVLGVNHLRIIMWWMHNLKLRLFRT